LRQLKKLGLVLCLIILVLISCAPRSPTGVAPFIYLSGDRKEGHSFVEYYPAEEQKQYLNKNVGGDHYINSYNDGKRLYLSLGHALFVYDSPSKKIKEFVGYESNAMKKINGDVWVALDKGLRVEGYLTTLCKLTNDWQFECLYEAKNQQLTDFYFDFDNQVFYGAGPGVSAIHGGGEFKVTKYDMQTGEEIDLRNAGEKIVAGRLTSICPGQFITSDGDIYRETGEKIGEVIGTTGKKLSSQVNDVVGGKTVFLDSDSKLMEVYTCKNNKTTHERTIKLTQRPNLYPVYHSWETTDDGEISMPIRSDDNIFEHIGFQSVNVRTGEVQVHLFDERVHEVHAVARFV